MEGTMEPTRKTVTGHMYVSGNGQIVIDSHPTDDAHLTSNQTRLEQPLYDCRTYISDLVPDAWIDKHGMLTVERVTDDNGDVVSVWLSFTPGPTRP
jgi:hypothetical protein